VGFLDDAGQFEPLGWGAAAALAGLSETETESPRLSSFHTVRLE